MERTTRSASSSVFTAWKRLKAPVSDWLQFNASWLDMAAESGPRASSMQAPRFISRLPKLHWHKHMSGLGRILLVEDDPKDVELTLTALDEYNLANEVVVARDGEEALDYLFYRGGFRARAQEKPA